jgi:hypothetical protein
MPRARPRFVLQILEMSFKVVASLHARVNASYIVDPIFLFWQNKTKNYKKVLSFLNNIISTVSFPWWGTLISL